MMNEIPGKEFDTARVITGISIDGSDTNDFHLVALVSSNHASMMLTNCSNGIMNGDTKKLRVRSDLV